MAYSLGAKSIAELEGVHPSLVSVVKRAIEVTDQDFSVHDGLRTVAEQREYVRRGVSKTMNSIELGVPLTWGGVWDRAFLDLDGTPAAIEQAVNAYVTRRRGAGKTAFIDGPHFQMG